MIPTVDKCNKLTFHCTFILFIAVHTVECSRFREGNDDRCLAAIVHEMSLTHCGDDFIFVRDNN